MSARAVVFDFDGVLVDSEPAHFRALHDALAAEGVDIAEDEYRSRYMARNAREALRLALEHHRRPAGPTEIDRLAAPVSERFLELIPQIPLFPGARELVDALAAEVPLGIASGARRNQIEAILRRHGLQESFATLVSVQDVPRTKPDPAPYVEVVRRLGARVPALEARHCVALEDSVQGITAARGAGLAVVGVAHTLPAEGLRAADHVVESLRALDPAAVLALASE
jgi:beta-phosphoglucomutase